LETLHITDFKNYAELHSVDVNRVIKQVCGIPA